MAAAATVEKVPLTDRQREILLYLVSYWGVEGSWPTLREIGAEFGISSVNGVVHHLKALAAKGWIEWDRTTGQVGKRSRATAVPELVEAAGRAAKAYLMNLRED